MLFSSKASDDLWDKAVVTTSYLRNRRPERGIPSTPNEQLTGVKPDISHLRTFGARAYVTRHDMNKLEARCSPGLLLGYSATFKAHRVLLDDGRIVTSTNVVVHEGKIRLDDPSDDREDSADEEGPGGGGSEGFLPCADDDDKGLGLEDSEDENVDPARDDAGGDADAAEEHDDAAPRRSGRDRRPPGEWWRPTANVATAETEPSTFEETMKSPSASE
jgi:hypothetical protein